MSHHEISDYSNRSHLPDFIVPHDGTQREIPESERLLVTQKFDTLIDGFLQNNGTEVFHSDYTNEDSLVLEAPDIAGNHWHIRVRAKTDEIVADARFSPSEMIRKEIFLQRIEGYRGRDALAYRLFADGVVRRWDGGDGWAKSQQKREWGLAPESIEPRTPSVEALIQTMLNREELLNVTIPNARLETQMGLQNQPIGLTELEGLEELLSRPDVTVQAN
jgi:hypothetical protein